MTDGEWKDFVQCRAAENCQNWDSKPSFLSTAIPHRRNHSQPLLFTFHWGLVKMLILDCGSGGLAAPDPAFLKSLQVGPSLSKNFSTLLFTCEAAFSPSQPQVSGRFIQINSLLLFNKQP